MTNEYIDEIGNKFSLCGECGQSNCQHRCVWKVILKDKPIISEEHINGRKYSVAYDLKTNIPLAAREEDPIKNPYKRDYKEFENTQDYILFKKNKY